MALIFILYMGTPLSLPFHEVEVCVEQSYQSAVTQINDIRRKKALLNAHSQLAKETVVRVEEFTKQIRHKHELLTELRKYDCVSDGQ